MHRAFVLLCVLIAAVIGGRWLIDHLGMVTMAWGDYELQIHLALAVLLFLLLTWLTAATALLLRQLATWPKRRRERAVRRNLTQGIAHLTRAVTALALGNENEADTALKKARAALPNEPLPELLTAQLLQRRGQGEAARTHLRALLAHESTAILATHRLIEQHLAHQEWGEAAQLAEQAHAQHPKDRWLILTLLDLYAHLGNTPRLLSLTEGWQFQSPLSKSERHRYAAIAHYLRANSSPSDRTKEAALRHATGYAPDFLPATLALAALWSHAGQSRAARKLLQHAWRMGPSIQLIPAILAALNDASPRQQTRLLKAFLRGKPTYAQHLLAAQHALKLGQLEQAKPLLEAALALEETKQACALMAELEHALHGSEAAAVWLARAMDAPTAPSHICQQCGTSHAAWQPHCTHCHAFDSLRFERPEDRRVSVELTPAQ